MAIIKYKEDLSSLNAAGEILCLIAAGRACSRSALIEATGLSRVTVTQRLNALLAAGLDPGEIVNCPPTITVGGRSFRNFEGGAAGAVPFRTDFAESCNTAFISLADRLGPDDLRAAGDQYGLGDDYRLGVPAFSGDVPVVRDEVEMAASMIGQGEILASPLAMAGFAAAVADGRGRGGAPLGGGGRRPERGSCVEDKRAAIGIRLCSWISFHGISLNVAPDLEPFSGIVPCGVSAHGVTSLADLGIRAAMSDVDRALRAAFEQRFGPTKIE